MPATLEDIATLWSTLGKLGPTKRHLFRAGREILLAVESILKIAEDYLSSAPLSADKKALTDIAISTCQRVIKTLAGTLGNGTDEEAHAVHNQVLDSIISVINEELGRLATAARATPADRIKLQALTSIRETLDRQRTATEMEEGEHPLQSMRAGRMSGRRGRHAARHRYEKNAHR